MSPPEILVHAAAPSHGSDDARYRREALGILGFEAVKRHNVLLRQSQHSLQIAEGGRSQSRIAQDVGQALGQDSITSTDPIPRHHLTDAFTTWVTPILPRPSPQILVGRTPAPSFYERASAVSGNLQVKHTPADRYRPRAAPSGPSAIQETPHLRRSFSDSFETPPSVIPDSQPTLPSQHHGKRPFEESSSPSPTHRQSPRAKRTKSDIEEELEEWTQPEDTSTPPLKNPPQESSSAPGSPNVSTRSPSPATHHDQPSIHSYRRRQVLPPRPKTGNDSFSTHLTPNLQTLQKHCTTFLQTVKPRRTIGMLERGHWHFTISNDDKRWDRVAREEMWAFLEDFIQGGHAGWGVWAVFEEGLPVGDKSVAEAEDGDVRREDSEKSLDGRGGRGNGTVKVYCWGEVVPEIYTVLVLATKRKVKKCGARWIDAGGDVVVDMGTG
ncbi:MAG: hypothetical protein Q9225_003338 [Loekoesia sp. 1 TL-2023]